jgi:leader peptidase (prepilin peptidase) / N-methyltransferase
VNSYSNSIIAQVYAFIFGACIGSFLNVCIIRWPAERSVLRPRSRCPSCGNQLAWFENVPILSWVALRGRCRCCDESISMMYPLIELIVACGWMLSVHYYGVTFTALRVAIFGTTLLGVAITDARHYLIPDGFTLFGLMFALLSSIVGFFRLEQQQVLASP